MAGYGATARLVPDLALGERRSWPESGPTRRSIPPDPRAPAPAWSEADPAAFEELRAIRAPSPKAFFERVDRLRVAWAQTTFYLFSPESWR